MSIRGEYSYDKNSILIFKIYDINIKTKLFQLLLSLRELYCFRRHFCALIWSKHYIKIFQNIKITALQGKITAFRSASFNYDNILSMVIDKGLEVGEMSKKDMIQLICAFEGFARLNDLVKELTNGCTIENRKFNELYYVGDVIQRNSRYYKDDDETCRLFWNIMYDKKTTPEEKYEQIKI